jgi:hypothetical protein
MCSGFEEFISRSTVILAAKPAHNWVKDWYSLNNADGKQSPEMSKKGKGKQMKSPQNPPPDFDFPQSSVSPKVGVTAAVHQFLEVRRMFAHPTIRILTQHRLLRSWDTCSP